MKIAAWTDDDYLACSLVSFLIIIGCIFGIVGIFISEPYDNGARDIGITILVTIMLIIFTMVGVNELRNYNETQFKNLKQISCRQKQVCC